MKVSKGKLILIIMSVWIGILGASLFWLESDTRREEKLLAQTSAKAFFEQILVSRSWNALHRAVYVPITPTTQPNEYLPTQNRDLTTDEGLQLTMVNPSYMTRQMSELAEKNKNGIQFHITSIKPIRPENQATEWEERWLKSFEHGIKEQGEFFRDGQITWFRFMAPLLAEASCLQCHTRQGNKEGDILGGLSVSLPYPSHTHVSLYIIYSAMAALGMLLIFIGVILYERKQHLFDATFNSPVPTSVTDKNHMILMANDAYWAEFGPLPDKQKTIKCYEHRPGQSCHTETCPLTKIMNGSDNFSYEIIKEKDGELRHYIISAKPLLDTGGHPIGIVESFQDITKRKWAEKALEESKRKFEALSISDGLTGIANRRSFDEVLTQEYARHTRSGANLSLILLDIDMFKLFNDCYGHVRGDECLRQVAQAIADCATRPADLAARYGGEEFACILPETDRSGAVVIAEKIRQAIITLDIPHKASKVANHVTASLGVVTAQCAGNKSVVDVITQVDTLLYRAKSAGRNRVEFAVTNIAGGDIEGNFVQLIWKDSFCSGNQLIDVQHQSLFSLANELLDAILSAHSSTEISALITRLLNDVSQHFHDEEIILEQAGFPGLNQHVTEHTKLLEKGLKLSQEFKTSTLTAGNVFQFLANEVVMLHLLGADRDYFPFINGADTAEQASKKSW